MIISVYIKSQCHIYSSEWHGLSARHLLVLRKTPQHTHALLEKSEELINQFDQSLLSLIICLFSHQILLLHIHFYRNFYGFPS